jgi:redox-sensing transcriptional repressor
MKSENIPAPAIRRLSLYLRQLEAFRKADRRTVSSKQLGEALKLTDAQVRKDLAYFGQFGHPGIGYRVDDLITEVKKILGTDKPCNVCIVGAGHLGKALTGYRGFPKKGFQLVAVFDNDPKKINTKELPDHIPVQPMHEMAETIERLEIRLAILCVPAEPAQQVAEQMVAAGIRGILNFAPVSLVVPDGFPVAGVDLAVQLEQLSFRLGGTKPAENK